MVGKSILIVGWLMGKYAGAFLGGLLLLQSCGPSGVGSAVRGAGGGLSLEINDSVKPVTFDLQSDIRDDFLSFIDSVRLIPLETTPESLVGYVDNLTVVHDTLFVVDAYKARAIFAFDLRSGRFLYKIGRVGHAPGEYLSMNHVDFNNGRITVLDWMTGKSISYDMSGAFLNERRLDSEVSTFYEFDDGRLVLCYDRYREASPFRLVIVDTALNRKQTAFPFDNTRQFPCDRLQKSATDSGFLFHFALSDTVYQVRPQEIVPKYCLSLYSENEVPDFMERTRDLSESAFMEELWNSDMVCFYSVLDMSDFLFVSYQKGRKSYVSLIGKSRGQVWNFKRADGLARRIYIPCTIVNCTVDNTLLGCVDETFFSQTSSVDRELFYASLSSESDIRTIRALEQDTGRNPVICLLSIENEGIIEK